MKLAIDLIDEQGNHTEKIIELTKDELTTLLNDLKAAQNVYLSES